MKKCFLADGKEIRKQFAASGEGKRDCLALRMEKQGGKMTKSTTPKRKNNNNTKDEKLAEALKIKAFGA